MVAALLNGHVLGDELFDAFANTEALLSELELELVVVVLLQVRFNEWPFINTVAFVILVNVIVLPNSHPELESVPDLHFILLVEIRMDYIEQQFVFDPIVKKHSRVQVLFVILSAQLVAELIQQIEV